jgi:DNA invertase Pin-like site-specific DNA recombinase
VNVVNYLRVSSLGQKDGDGFERQQKVVKTFCEAHKLVSLAEFSDSITGTSDAVDRPQFADMMGFISKRNSSLNGSQVHAIVVERMDRLARDLMVSEMLLKSVRECGLQVFSADQGALTDMASDGGDPTRVLVRQLMGAIAQWEKSVLVKKLKLARDRIKASGKHCEGTKPFGYCAAEKPILEIILDLHNGRTEGKWESERKNFSEIARLLNSMDARTRSGRPFKPQNVRMIITNHNNKQKAKS